MKDWQEIAKLYERDSIYLAESAQILVRNVNYELPGVKKQITKFDQLIDEAQKKIQDQTASEAVLNAQRTALCQKLGIKGDHLREEFAEKLKDLPKFYQEIATLTTKLREACEAYGKASKNMECLPVLRHIVENGNTTVYEYIHHEAPLYIEEPPIQIKLTIDADSAPANNTVSAKLWKYIIFDLILMEIIHLLYDLFIRFFFSLMKIDFGEGDIDFGEADIDFGEDIDFGDVQNATDVNLETGNINWGDDDAVDADINFDIALKDSGITVESSGMEGGVAKNTEALTVLDSPNHREQFLDELFEVIAVITGLRLPSC